MKKASRKVRTVRQFTAIIQRDGKWFIAFCPEVPGANGQGRTKASCRKSLVEAIKLMLEIQEEAVPRHIEIGKHLSRKICRNLSVPEPPGA